MKRLLITTFLLGTAPAMAADLPTKAPAYKAPPSVAYSWTGCFVGGNVGGINARTDYTAAPPDPVASIGDHHASSVIGGVQAGCDYQISNWVIGIQGDYDWTSAKGQHAGLLAPDFVIHSQATSISSVTARLGYAWMQWLGYIRGGGAWTRNKYDTVFTPTATLFDQARDSRSGWTVGAGGEYAITSYLSAFAEYDFYDFGTRRNFFFTPGGAPTFNADIGERAHVFKVGLNLRYSPGAAGWRR
jgi:outer membrane immunogenic protein